MEFEIVKNYRENETLRHSFEKLAQETFGIDFESWYQNGFWTNRYNPYSVLLDGEIVANVSVNQMKMRLAEKEYHFTTTFFSNMRYFAILLLLLTSK